MSCIEIKGDSDEDIIIVDCDICIVLKKKFSLHSVREQRDIVRRGRPKPTLSNITLTMNKHARKIHNEIYKSTDWICGCECTYKLFCWPCLLFSPENNIWNASGVCDLSGFQNQIKKHARNKSHILAVIHEKVFERSGVVQAVVQNINYRQYNLQVQENREMVKKLIDVVIYIGANKLEFGQHDSSKHYAHLIDLFASYDKNLQKHLENETGFNPASISVKDNLMASVVAVAHQKIKEEILQASFVALIFDETPDPNNNNALSVTIRYATSDAEIHERFLEFTPSERKVDRVFEMVCNTISKLDCYSKLVAQCYDGGVVAANELRHLQTTVKESFTNAIFVHYYGHSFTLIISQSVSSIPDCKAFFSILNGMSQFFSKSCEENPNFKIALQDTLDSGTEIEPTEITDFVKLILTKRLSLIGLFNDIIFDSDKWDYYTINNCRLYMDVLQTDVTFNFLLLVFSEILASANSLFDTLHHHRDKIDYCVLKINEFKNAVHKKRENFPIFWEKLKGFDMHLQRHSLRFQASIDIEPVYKRFLYDIVDNIMEQFGSRFKDYENLKLVGLVNFTLNKYLYSQEAYEFLTRCYANYFDMFALSSQLSVIYSTDYINKNNLCELLKYLRFNGLETACSEVIKLCELMLTLPSLNCFAETSCLTLQRIRGYVANSTQHERLSNLAFLSIEQEMLKQLTEKQDFYDCVISEFSKREPAFPLHCK